jgi:hypothetical protein
MANQQYHISNMIQDGLIHARISDVNVVKSQVDLGVAVSDDLRGQILTEVFESLLSTGSRK